MNAFNFCFSDLQNCCFEMHSFIITYSRPSIPFSDRRFNVSLRSEFKSLYSLTASSVLSRLLMQFQMFYLLRTIDYTQNYRGDWHFA